MILKSFSQNRANKLSKMIIPAIKEPIDIRILWLQYEDFNSLSEHFNNKLHRHTFYELHFILEGNGIITDHNQKEYTVHSGEAIFVPQDLPHAFKYKNEKLKRFSIAFTLPGDMMPTKIFADFIIIKLHDSIIENLNTIFVKADKNTALSLYVIRNRICEILFDILNLEEHTDIPLNLESNHTNLYIDKSKKYINDNLDIILTCKNVADYCHINEIYLNRVFKKHTGETLLKYIHRKKIAYSIELLKNEELSLSTISTMLGFANEYHFNTFFKKAVGLPPGAYRNIYFKGSITNNGVR